jgi:hypothetical protein
MGEKCSIVVYCSTLSRNNTHTHTEFDAQKENMLALATAGFLMMTSYLESAGE